MTFVKYGKADFIRTIAMSTETITMEFYGRKRRSCSTSDTAGEEEIYSQGTGSRLADGKLLRRNRNQSSR